MRQGRYVDIALGRYLGLFLTSKVRLHCDRAVVSSPSQTRRVPFPDLKGQAPLRPLYAIGLDGRIHDLFLTSKVRLHCDHAPRQGASRYMGLFLTSKVRLHCDVRLRSGMSIPVGPFS